MWIVVRWSKLGVVQDCLSQRLTVCSSPPATIGNAPEPTVGSSPRATIGSNYVAKWASKCVEIWQTNPCELVVKETFQDPVANVQWFEPGYLVICAFGSVRFYDAELRGWGCSALLEDDHLGQAKSQYIETGVHDYLPRAFATSVKKVARAYSITISYRVQPRKDFRFTLTVTENEILNLKKSQGWALLDLPHLSVVRELDNIRILDSKGNSESLSYPCKGERFEAACSQTGNFVVAWRSDCGGTESAWRLKKPGLSVGDSEGILGQENFNKTVKRRIETHHDEEATPPMKKATRRSQAYKGKKENA